MPENFLLIKGVKIKKNIKENEKKEKKSKINK